MSRVLVFMHQYLPTYFATLAAETSLSPPLPLDSLFGGSCRGMGQCSLLVRRALQAGLRRRTRCYRQTTAPQQHGRRNAKPLFCMSAYHAPARLNNPPSYTRHYASYAFPSKRCVTKLRNPRYDLLDGAPYAYNGGGVKDVQDRAERLTDPAVLAAAGNGDQFPLYYMPLAENGNFLESNEIAKRHGVCGDPRLVRLN